MGYVLLRFIIQNLQQPISMPFIVLLATQLIYYYYHSSIIIFLLIFVPHNLHYQAK